MAPPSSTPETMRAWIVGKNGEPADALSLKTDWPAPPAPKGSEILIRVSYVALNPADLHFMRNIPSWLPFRRNAIPGLDFCGEVVAAGPAAPADRSVGAEVCGSMSVGLVATGRGGLAEYVLVPADLVASKPPSLAPSAAVGLLGIAGQTAHIVIHEAQVKEGDCVAINGASGGVGSVLIQIAKAKGAVVTAICSGANEAMVRRLGADDVRIDFFSRAACALTNPGHRLYAPQSSNDMDGGGVREEAVRPDFRLRRRPEIVQRLHQVPKFEGAAYQHRWGENAGRSPFRPE